MKTENLEKLVWNLYDKSEYVIYIKKIKASIKSWTRVIRFI